MSYILMNNVQSKSLYTCIYSIISRVSAIVNFASVLLCTSSTSTPGASSVSVSSPVVRSTWKTHYDRSAWLSFQLISWTYQISNDGADNIGARQRQTALLHDLRRSILGDMAGGYHNLGIVGVGDQVHCSSHSLEYLAGDHVVGQITVGAHLQGSKNRHIDVTSANHAEGLGAVECGSSGNQSHSFFAGIDYITGCISECCISGVGKTYASNSCSVG